jgi:hypothetical protein
MDLSRRVKIALDETRMLILGAQILVGFQFRGLFSDDYDQLSKQAIAFVEPSSTWRGHGSDFRRDEE